jgi:hypothetical protein
MYHELPWLRWRGIRILNPLQSWISGQLGRQAAIAVTHNAQFQSILQSWLHHPVHCLPNFSTVGELTQPSPLQDRQRQLVIFGSTDRDRVYRHSLAEIRRLYQDFQLEAIYDVGRSLDLPRRYDLQGLNLIELGFQPAERVSQILAQSRFAALDYRHFPGNLAKSTIFAAICAHGTVPLCTQYNPSEADGLYRDRHYLLLDARLGQNREAKLQAIADAAYLWYSTHSLEKNTKAWASYFRTEILGHGR